MVIAAVLSFTAMLLLYIMDGAVAILPTSSMASFVCISLLIVAIAAIVYALTKNSMIALIAAGVGIIPNCVCFLLMRDSYEGLFPNLVGYLAVFNRFYDFAYGLFDVTAIVYFLSITVFFVFLSVLSVEKKRWN
jgi:ABC-2 type transport system permease protein